MRPLPPAEPILAVLVERARLGNSTLSVNTAAVAAARTRTTLADKAWYPDVTVGAGPLIQTNNRPVGFAATVGVNIPIPWGREAFGQREAAAQLGATQQRYEATRLEIEGALGEATARLQAARATEALLRREARPQARAAFQTVLAGYSQGRGELTAAITAEHQMHDVELRLLPGPTGRAGRTRRDRAPHWGRPVMRMVLAACAAVLVAGGIARSEDTARQPLYYQDPDGKPYYAAGPKKSADGKDYRPVFEDLASTGAPSPEGSEPASQQARMPALASRSADHGRILYYRNPMGLPDTSPVPKKDSMGMEYIPVHENEAADAGSGLVTIAPGRMQVLGVRTAPVETPAVLTRTVRATGTVQFDERRMAVVSTRVGGWVERLEVGATGDAVRRGQVMADIYAPDLVASEEEFLVVSRVGAMATAAAQRLRALGIPDDEIARLRRTGKAAQRIPVLAPADGIVTEKMVVQGTRVGPEQPLYRTASLSPHVAHRRGAGAGSGSHPPWTAGQGDVRRLSGPWLRRHRRLHLPEPIGRDAHRARADRHAERGRGLAGGHVRQRGGRSAGRSRSRTDARRPVLCRPRQRHALGCPG